MKIYLVRHGETLESEGGIILGRLPGKLNQKGREYSKKVASFISDILGPLTIISSPLGRASETAEIISEITKIPVIYNELLMERSAGIAEGKKNSEIDWESYEKVPLESRKHLGGESFLDVNQRAKDFLSLIKGENHDVLVITHSVVISMILSEFLGWDFEKSLGYKYQNEILMLDLNEKRGNNVTPVLVK